MRITVLDSDSAIGPIGVTFRRHRPGPERKLVEWFLEELPFHVPRGCRATIFCEPRIESGFPDLVAVIWHVATSRQWNEARTHLSCSDIRVMHYLHQAGPCSLENLESLFSRAVSGSVERLQAAEMIRRVHAMWTARALSRCFATRRIIAVEAKVREWALALEQATLNTWFASDSYILVPHFPRGDRLLDAVQAFGVGVLARHSVAGVGARSSTSQLPRSYASWLFNEWSWRAAKADSETSL